LGSDLEQLLPAQVFSRRVKEARESLGWSQQQLVDELKRLGYPMPRSSLTKIENEHSPRADARLRDVLALASALRVPPVHLLVPLEDEATIAVTPEVRLGAPLARAWIRGQALLPQLPAPADLSQMPDSELLAYLRADLAHRVGKVAAFHREKIDEMAREWLEQIRNPEREEVEVAE